MHSHGGRCKTEFSEVYLNQIKDVSKTLPLPMAIPPSLLLLPPTPLIPPLFPKKSVWYVVHAVDITRAHVVTTSASYDSSIKSSPMYSSSPCDSGNSRRLLKQNAILAALRAPSRWRLRPYTRDRVEKFLSSEAPEAVEKVGPQFDGRKHTCCLACNQFQSKCTD